MSASARRRHARCRRRIEPDRSRNVDYEAKSLRKARATACRAAFYRVSLALTFRVKDWLIRAQLQAWRGGLRPAAPSRYSRERVVIDVESEILVTEETELGNDPRNFNGIPGWNLD